jgi:RNA polymerase sigma-B factor
MHVSRLLTRTLAQLRAQVEAQVRADEGDGPPVAV